MFVRAFRSLPRPLQTRVIVWGVRGVAVCTIASIGVSQYIFGNGILPHVLSGSTRLANLSLGQSDGSRFELKFSTQPGNGTPATGVPAPAAQIAPDGGGLRAVSSCDIAIPKAPAAPEGRIHRVSFPSATGGLIEGYGIDETLLPDRSSHALAVLEWVRSQGGVTSVRNSGSKRDMKGTQLPSLLSAPTLPEEDGDYLMGVAHGAVDLLSVGQGNYAAELNPWYHSLNAGFRTRILQATDCDRASSATTASNDRAAIRAVGSGPVYVSDGNSELLDFKVNGRDASGAVGSEVKLPGPGVVTVTANLKAMLGGSATHAAGWNIENARIGTTNTVAVEIVANGKVVASRAVPADGSTQQIAFDIPLEHSSWIAVRLLGAGHSNPAYVVVDNQPVRASRASVEWSMRELLRDFEAKSERWAAADANQARAAYEYAYAVYAKIMAETAAP